MVWKNTSDGVQDNGLTLNGIVQSWMKICNFKLCCCKATLYKNSFFYFQVSYSLIHYLSRGADMRPRGLSSGNLVMMTTLSWLMITFTLSMSCYYIFKHYCGVEIPVPVFYVVIHLSVAVFLLCFHLTVLCLRTLVRNAQVSEHLVVVFLLSGYEFPSAAPQSSVI